MTTPRTLKSALSAATLRLAPALHRRVSLGERLTQHCRDRLALPQARVGVSFGRDDAVAPHAVAIRLGQRRMRVRLQEPMLGKPANELLHRIGAVLTVVAGAPGLQGAELVADISDGEDSGPGLISFCSRDPDAILIPDHVYLRTGGYAAERALARANVMDWDERSDRITWRGQNTGAGLSSKPHLSVNDPELNARVRLCLALKDVPGTDVKLSDVTHGTDIAVDRARLENAGIVGSFVSSINWHSFKFAIDIDGHSNAWSNLFTRLLTGCCVLKVASAAGYRQWYYGDLEPFVHYVPVKADLSDLHDMIAWCRVHPAECRRIAERGQTLAVARDVDTEVAATRTRIAEAYAGSRLRARTGASGQDIAFRHRPVVSG